MTEEHHASPRARRKRHDGNGGRFLSAITNAAAPMLHRRSLFTSHKIEAGNFFAAFSAACCILAPRLTGCIRRHFGGARQSHEAAQLRGPLVPRFPRASGGTAPRNGAGRAARAPRCRCAGRARSAPTARFCDGRAGAQLGNPSRTGYETVAARRRGVRSLRVDACRRIDDLSTVPSRTGAEPCR